MTVYGESVKSISFFMPIFTLVNVYVALPVFTPVSGSSYAYFMEQNGGTQYVNSEFGR